MTLRQLSFQHLLIAALFFCTFCIIELVIGFRSCSLALIADAFHISYNLIELIFALISFIKIQELERHGLRTLSSLGSFTFGWERIEILGAFFNGVFLLALSTSIALQTIKKFVDPHPLINPMDIIIVGCVGLALKLVSAFVIYERENEDRDQSTHMAKLNVKYAREASSNITSRVTDDLEHQGHSSYKSPAQALSVVDPVKSHYNCGRESRTGSSKKEGCWNFLDLAIYLSSYSLNSLLIIISAAFYMKTGFIYCDCIASACIGLMMFTTILPLLKKSASILLESSPSDLDMNLVVNDLEKAHNVERVTGIHVWQLTRSKVLSTIQVTLKEPSLIDFNITCSQICLCLNSWGIHQVCIQPSYQNATGKLEKDGPDQPDSSSITSPDKLLTVSPKGDTTASCQDRDFQSSPYHLPPIQPSTSDDGICNGSLKLSIYETNSGDIIVE